ncbi:MAG: branched-chain amino acid ABC transporter permease [Defluviitaleaceae bacterium]|nr:branched-chain amino acid ABC transporter permease [Defluviitaleaceae bacterium]
MMQKISSYRPYLDYVIFGLLLCVLPFLVDARIMPFAWLTIIGGVVIYSIVSFGMNILMGYAGLASLGTAGFMGLGAYLSVILTVDAGLPFLLVFVIVIVVTMLLGVIVGLISLRVEGFFLAIATLVVAEILRQVFIAATTFTGSFAGRTARFPEIFGFALNRNSMFIMMVIFLVLAMFITHNIFKSPTGRAMSAMRGSESAAAAMGVNIFRYRLVAFAIATGFAGAGGSLYMHFVQFTFPNVWILILSLNIFAVVVIGGVRSVAGTILGAFIVFGVPHLVLANLPVIGDVAGLGFVFTGVVIILVVLFYPAGLIYVWYDILKLFSKLKNRKKGGDAA